MYSVGTVLGVLNLDLFLAGDTRPDPLSLSTCRAAANQQPVLSEPLWTQTTICVSLSVSINFIT